MTASKVARRMLKHALFLLVALSTGGAWIFYFADAPRLLRDLVTLNAHPVAYTTIAIMTATTFFFGGFAREQICIYACPWPRIQGAMMDEMDGMDGMSLEELAKLSGDDFDQAFLEQMIAHHQMALEMAEMELQMGTDPELRAMAEKMIEDQQVEIELMQGWLEEWFAA